MPVTDGHLLGGRLLYRQPASGYRSGLEPVLLAAAVAARPDDLVLEAGTGAGAALLCLCARAGGVRAVGVEIDDGMAGLARANAAANGFEHVEIIAGDFATVPLGGPFDHAMANPPYHLVGGTASPLASRETAKRGSEAMMFTWIGRMAGALRDRGSLTLIVPAGMVPTCMAAMAASLCPCTALLPLWPRAARPAKLVLLRGIKHARTSMRLLAGLVLHGNDGAFTSAAERVLRDGDALSLDGPT